MTCGHCGTTVPDDGDRCPKCLRKSGLLAAEAPQPAAASVDHPPRPTARPLRAVVALLVTALVVVGLRVMGREVFVPAPSVRLPAGTINLDPHDLDRVPVRSSRSLLEGQLYAVNLTADAGDFMRTLEKLRVHALAATVNELKKDQSADGLIRLYLPPRFRTPAHEQRVEDENRTMVDALAKAHVTTPKGDPVRITIEFGELPDGR